MLKEQLKNLEEKFRENGYTEQMIEEIKCTDGASGVPDYIDNLEEEQSCWGE